MKNLENKNIVLGVCGGIAAYKSAELLRLLKKAGAVVRVIMTKSALKFVGKATFEALSENSVCIDLFEEKQDASIRHIDWAVSADAVVIAPATANFLGKFASGIADDALSTFMLAVKSQTIVCPSMNSDMFESPQVQKNIETLQNYGVTILQPDSGELACKTSGTGRLPEPEYIADRVAVALQYKDLKGKKILITAGPTREFFDPVRFISNPSSGKMGFAIAKGAEYRGADVVLITGPCILPDPANVEVVRVTSAQNMADAVFARMEYCDIIIKTAAVSDYRPETIQEHKIKKSGEQLSLILKKNIDILKEVGKRKKNQILVGFAAETQELKQNAVSKLTAKNLDIIVGNLVGDKAGFGTDTNKVTLFYKNGEIEKLPDMEKQQIGGVLLDRIKKSLKN